MKSIVTEDLTKCIECCKNYGIEIHHVYFGKNRKKSTEDGCIIPLCYEHHRGTNGIHGKSGKEIDLKYKKITELKWLEYYKKDIEDFIERFGKNYL